MANGTAFCTATVTVAVMHPTPAPAITRYAAALSSPVSWFIVERQYTPTVIRPPPTRASTR